MSSSDSPLTIELLVRASRKGRVPQEDGTQNECLFIDKHFWISVVTVVCLLVHSQAQAHLCFLVSCCSVVGRESEEVAERVQAAAVALTQFCEADEMLLLLAECPADLRVAAGALR